MKGGLAREGLRKFNLHRRLLGWLARFDPRPRVLFLDHWYSWVEAPLFERVSRLLWWKRRVRRVSRLAVEAYADPEPGRIPTWDLTEDTYRTQSYAGFNLWELAKSSICDQLLRPVPELPQDEDVLKEFYDRTSGLIDAFEGYFRAIRPRSIVVCQGLQYDQRVAVEVGRRMGVQTVAVENSFLRDYFFIDDSSGAITNRHWLARGAWDTVRARVLTPDQRADVRTLLSGSSTTFDHPEAIDNDQLLAQLGIPPGKRIVLLLGQVAVDAAVVMDSYLFPDQLVFMRELCAFFERYENTHHLVIRLHPKEATGTSHDGTRPFGNMTLERIRQEGLDRFPFVSVVHSSHANTYQLMNLADFGVTLTSQTGLEMLARYKQVVVVGDAFYARHGFTVDVAHVDDLMAALERVIAMPGMTAEQEHAVDNFLHFALCDYMYPKTLAGVDNRLKELFR